MQLFAYYEDELESMLSEEEHQSLNDGFCLNMTVSILWFCSALSSLPTLIVWSKSQKYFHLLSMFFDVLDLIFFHRS